MPRCRTCGAFVSEQYVRVFSRDGEGVDACEAEACPATRDNHGRARLDRRHGEPDAELGQFAASHREFEGGPTPTPHAGGGDA